MTELVPLVLQGLVLFKIDDEEWTLDLRSGKGKVSKGGAGSDKPDLTLTISDGNFVKLVMGKMGPQQVLLDCQSSKLNCIARPERCVFLTFWFVAFAMALIFIYNL